MTTSNEKPVIPADFPPEAPAELQAKREGIVAALEAEASTASGNLQQVLRVLAQTVNNCRPDAQLDFQLDMALRQAFQRYEPEMGHSPMPKALVDGVAWMQEYVQARGFPVSTEGSIPAQKVQGSGATDVFEKVQNKMSLTGEQPAVAPQGEAQEGGLKNWQLNPGLGKVRG